jgi:hypothetical protein
MSNSVKKLVLMTFHILSLGQGRLANFMLTAKPRKNCTTLNLFSESESKEAQSGICQTPPMSGKKGIKHIFS